MSADFNDCLHRAQSAMGAQDYDRAIEQYAQCLQIDPQNAAATYELGVAYQAAGRNAEAAQYYQQALVIDRSHFDAANNAAALFVAAGDVGAAVAILAGFIEDNRNHLMATLNITSILMRHRRPRDAIRYFEDYLVVRPGDPSATINLVTAMNSIGEGTKATKYIKSWMRIHPDDVRAYHMMGYCLFTYCHDYAAACESYKGALSLRPDDHSLRINYIKALQCAGRHEAAIEEAALLEGSDLRLKSARYSRLPAYA